MVVHVSHTYGIHGVGGADEAASRRHLEMLENGTKSIFVCCEVSEYDEQIDSVLLLPQNRITRFIYRFFSRKVVRYGMRALCLPMASNMGIVPIGLKSVIDKYRPERVYLHYLSGEMLRYEELLAIKSPVTIVLHDFSLVSGELCSTLKAGLTSKSRLDRWLFWRKKRVLSQLDVSFEAPSKWAAKICGESEMGKGRPIVVRPGNVDSAFKECRAVKKNDGIFRILFGCRNGRSNPAKGFVELEGALSLLPTKIREKCLLRVFGESADECVTGGVRTQFLGEINSPELLARIYQESDVFAFPSISETQGLVKDEALACGLKVVTFDRTACPEGIRHKENGYIAKDVADFANGLVWAMESRQ